MKTTLTLSLLALFLAATPFVSAPQDEPESLIEELDWLAGRWVADGGGQYMEETWSPAREDAMIGCFRWARKGEVWLYEMMSIEADEEHGLVFRLRHFSRNLEPWASEKDGPLTYPLENFEDDRVVFENPESDSPRRFIYQREGKELSIRLEKADGTADAPFRFRLDE